MSCIFCDILAGRVPASFLHRDDRVAAFMDIQPMNPGHVLVVPTAHVEGLRDISEGDAAAVMATTRRVAEAIRRTSLRCEGVNLFLADGEAAMQEIFHFHLHVFPRFRGDGFGLTFHERYFEKPPRTEIEEAAEQIRREMGR